MAKARALAGLLAFCIFFDIHAISIFGVSKTMIDHVKGTSHVRSPHLAGWMDRIMSFWRLMRDCYIQHIYRAQNQQADCLSDSRIRYLVHEGNIYGENSCFIEDFSISGS